MFRKPVFGRWRDIYGDTVLTFKGSILLVGYGDHIEKFKAGFENNDGIIRIFNKNKEQKGFGLIGEITLKRDGRLHAYEQVLDAEGHHYIFVEEDKWEEASAVKDLSSDTLQKEITGELKCFYLYLKHYSNEKLPYGNYNWEIEKDNDASYSFLFEGMGDSMVIIRHNATVDRDYIKGLEKLIADEELYKSNGFFMSNDKNDVFYSLNAEYENGEELSVKVGSKAVDKWCVKEKKFLEYALSIIPKEHLEQ